MNLKSLSVLVHRWWQIHYLLKVLHKTKKWMVGSEVTDCMLQYVSSLSKCAGLVKNCPFLPDNLTGLCTMKASCDQWILIFAVSVRSCFLDSTLQYQSLGFSCSFPSKIFVVSWTLGAVNIFTSSPLNVHWTFRGEGVMESQDLDVRVGNLGQNQNTVQDNRTWRENRTGVENENKFGTRVVYADCHFQRWRRSNTRSLDFPKPKNVFCLDIWYDKTKQR